GSRSSSALSKSVRPARTTAWSSTTRILMLIGQPYVPKEQRLRGREPGLSAETGRTACSSQRHLDHERRPRALPGLDLEPAVEERDPLAHADQAEAAVARLARVEPPAVVLDHGHHRALLSRQEDADAPGA